TIRIVGGNDLLVEQLLLLLVPGVVLWIAVAVVYADIPLWEYDWDHGQRLIEAGLMTHLLTSHCALELLRRRHGGLVVEVTDGTRKYNATHFRGTVVLDLTKTAVDRLAYAEGHELVDYDGTAVSVTPGWLRSEMMLDA